MYIIGRDVRRHGVSFAQPLLALSTLLLIRRIWANLSLESNNRRPRYLRYTYVYYCKRLYTRFQGDCQDCGMRSGKDWKRLGMTRRSGIYLGAP
ncbi:uncharacterized protein F4807DRAFT_298931 [Annulohypoxylon truncatum]|uniref:uncharacterized protein n=1 Tax=Annulohypoxylon truncatum TaxID=327061 RepID=UPI0020075BC1|nr:uncharacterized protein F4807DRAFT_298931 [Annulohypoxylon truncatum]KAI1205034.1 hypothetical protein F4807DRAFT_298931 [Annulohypoxylon truncatum]